VAFSFVIPDRNTLKITRWPPNVVDPPENRPLRAPSRAEKTSGGTRGARLNPQIPPLQGTLTARRVGEAVASGSGLDGTGLTGPVDRSTSCVPQSR